MSALPVELSKVMRQELASSDVVIEEFCPSMYELSVTLVWGVGFTRSALFTFEGLIGIHWFSVSDTRHLEDEFLDGVSFGDEVQVAEKLQMRLGLLQWQPGQEGFYWMHSAGPTCLSVASLGLSVSNVR
jgi:hypothetical protein